MTRTLHDFVDKVKNFKKLKLNNEIAIYLKVIFLNNWSIAMMNILFTIHSYNTNNLINYL